MSGARTPRNIGLGVHIPRHAPEPVRQSRLKPVLAIGAAAFVMGVGFTIAVHKPDISTGISAVMSRISAAPVATVTRDAMVSLLGFATSSVPVAATQAPASTNLVPADAIHLTSDQRARIDTVVALARSNTPAAPDIRFD